ncbi:helix-turn-helix transcriptional regulator [Vibrio aestuarianus]|uniref:helix-turn-helix domain-containing protein n=1 Tax=Vibrio aestuarianus TaxID=28171 RepID=UPI00237C8696|nr:helix-turn-helix transcriptional regulator [Vibrio aestuarianus]MDE1323873.1 helix-turn-helix transcriptional regulator [Vibrio aestuarianus]
MSKCRYPMTAMLIREARLRSGLEQKQFIDKHGLDISQATFSRWETGRTQAPTEILIKMGLVGRVIL